MQKVREWLRAWLVPDLEIIASKIDGIVRSIKQWEANWESRFALVATQRDAAISAAILKSQGFVPLMNQRIDAVEQTAVNGAGAEAIVRGVMEAYDRKFKGHLAQVEQEIESLTREVDELKRDIIAAAVAPKPKDVSKPEIRGREPWPVRRARIEAKERGKSDDMRPS